jgi:predicted AAA+ superfamily ATPase
METTGRFLQAHAGSFFLFGPRGTGKSTWLRALQGQALWIDMLDPETVRLFQARPERLLERIDAQPLITDVVIDEVQKVPAILDVVHKLVEGDRPLRFILTGSSARKLRRGAANLLAGRLTELHMHPFMAAELGDAFDLQRSLEVGLVPLIWSAIEPKNTLRAYASLYLQQEVQAEALVRNVSAFARFLEAISFSHGSLLNLAEVARECQVGRKTVEGYLEILEDLLLSFRLPVFTRRARRHLVAHDKFFYFDAGVYRSIRPKGPLDSPEEIEGMALEGLIAQHLRAWASYRNVPTELSYWRTKSGSEVDFVVYGDDVFVAIEVKRSRNVHHTDLRALKAFKEDYPEAQVCLLYMGQDEIKMGEVLCLPCDSFLKKLDPHGPIL